MRKRKLIEQRPTEATPNMNMKAVVTLMSRDRYNPRKAKV
jgi:hypothetical protein